MLQFESACLEDGRHENKVVGESVQAIYVNNGSGCLLVEKVCGCQVQVLETYINQFDSFVESIC